MPAGQGDQVSVNFTWDTATDTGAAASTTAAPGLIDSENPATVSFNIDNLYNGINPTYQYNQPGYNSVFLKLGLHEIGHLLGIGDYGQASAGDVPEPPAGSSVMNNDHGVNDTGQALTSPTTCDAAAAAKDSHVTVRPAGGSPAPPPPKSIPPNGGGGGGGGSSSTCGGGSYFDPDTNTVYGWC